jgi:hypothetical protein
MEYLSFQFYFIVMGDGIKPIRRLIMENPG